MNETVNNFMLAGGKFMLEMHLRQPGISIQCLWTIYRERICKFKETGDSKYICRNELDKMCFQHDMVYGHFKDLPRRAASDKVLRDKAFDIAKNPKYDGYQRGLASMVYNFFDKKSAMHANKSAAAKYVNKSATHTEKGINLENWQSAEELRKPIIRKLKKLKFTLPVKTIFGVLI